jgi:hypothetical protein
MPQRGTSRRPGVRGELPSRSPGRAHLGHARSPATVPSGSGVRACPCCQRVVAPPLIRECRAHLECELQSVTRLGAEVVIFGQIAGLHRRGRPRLAPGRDPGVLLMAGRYESRPGGAGTGRARPLRSSGRCRKTQRARSPRPARWSGAGHGMSSGPGRERSDQTACRTSVVTSSTRGARRQCASRAISCLIWLSEIGLCG